MNINFYLKKKHLFKKRIVYKVVLHKQIFKEYKHLYSVKRFKLEFVYMRLFKKIFRRKFVKRKMRFFKPKYWIFMLPNFILTRKSKNSRMGAGVGRFVRLTNMVNPGKMFLKTWRYKVRYLHCITKYLTYKIPNKFLVKVVKNKKEISNSEV